jgi:hypothetical protein
MAKEVIEIDVKTNISGAKSLSDLKSEFKELQKELSGLEQGSEQYISTLKRLGQVKDDIGDLRSEIEGFAGADKKVAAFGNVIGGVASGFAAAQGAAALFGAESESVEKALLKVQAAMALSQGIEGVIAMGDSFKVMKAVALDALKGIKTGIAATGIGLFVVALGTVVAYWDDIKAAVSGVSEEQKELNNLTDLNVNQEKEKLTELNSQDNVLKLQGLSEKEILNLKIKQTNEVIAATEQQIKQKQITSKLEIEAAERNANITKQILRGAMEINTVVLRAMAAPIDLLLTTANAVSEKLGLGQITAINLNKKISELNEFVGKTVGDLLFDPESVKADAEKTLAESEKSLKELINQRAGYQLQINAIDKTASNEAKKLAEEDDKWKREFEREVLRRQAEMDKEFYKEQFEKEKEQLKAEDERIEAEIQAEQKALDVKKALRLKAIEDYKKGEEQKVELTKQGLTAINSLADAFAGQDEASQKRAFEVKKAAGIAIATIETYQSASSAYASQMTIPTPDAPIRAAIAAGIAIATGVARIATIAKTQFKSSAAPSTGGGASNLGTFSQGGGGVQAPGLTSQNNVTQLNPDGSVAGQGNREMQPVKAYVVESESRAVTDRVNKLSNQSKIG